MSASLPKPLNSKIFLSYARADEAFADELVAGLEYDGRFQVSIDRKSIIEGEDWKSRLSALLASADTIVFVLSPSSAQSSTCAWEVEEAHRLSKRILPVLAAPLGTVPAPALLAALNYVRFDEGRSFMGGLSALARALLTDLDWLREHTRLLTLAMQWDDAGRQPYRMLSGNDIEAAKEWAANRPKDAPKPTELHLEFMRASEQAEETRLVAEREGLAEIAKAQKERATALAERELAVKKLSRRTIFAGVGGGTLAAAFTVGAAWEYNKYSRLQWTQKENERRKEEEANLLRRRGAERTDIRGQIVGQSTLPRGQSTYQSGGASVYTSNVLKGLEDVKLSVQTALQSANNAILQKRSRTRQNPYFSSDLNGEIFMLNQPESRGLSAILISMNSWDSRRSQDAEKWANFLKKISIPVEYLQNPTKQDVAAKIDNIEFKPKPVLLTDALSDETQTGAREKPKPPENTLALLLICGTSFLAEDGRRFVEVGRTDLVTRKDEPLDLFEIQEALRRKAAASICIFDV